MEVDVGFLDGVKVIDLSRLLPGPLCTWYLQGLGADIVKIEEPGVGDYLRHVPPLDEAGVSAWFSAVNAGKRSVALDLRRPAAGSALHHLLAGADVMVESFRPGVLARLGLAPEALRARHPHLIIASITGYGQEGPMASAPGHDLGYQALAGVLSLGRRRDGVPDLPASQPADVAGGALTAALQIAAALFARTRTGRGAWLDISMTEGALALVAPAFAATAVSGRPPVPGDELLTGADPAYGVYQCADGLALALAALEPKFWEALVRAVGRPVARTQEALRALFLTRSRDDWTALLRDACAVPVLELHELAAHPVHRARGSIVGEGAQARIRAPAPGAQGAGALPCASLGAHTVEVLEAAGVDPTPFTQEP